MSADKGRHLHDVFVLARHFGFKIYFNLKQFAEVFVMSVKEHVDFVAPNQYYFDVKRDCLWLKPRNDAAAAVRYVLHPCLPVFHGAF